MWLVNGPSNDCDFCYTTVNFFYLSDLFLKNVIFPLGKMGGCVKRPKNDSPKDGNLSSCSHMHTT